LTEYRSRMKQHIAILYADSRFTPWRENIDTATVRKVCQSLNPKYEVDIIHMIDPCAELADLLSQYYCVVNLCYGFKQMMQWEVAAWLDQHEIPHLSARGNVQQLAQHKKEVERLLCDFGLPVARSLNQEGEIQEGMYIVKPVSGGCHRNISIVSSVELRNTFHRLNPEEWMVQPYLNGREFSVAVLPDATGMSYETLPPVEIVPFPKREVFIAGQEYGTTTRDFFPVLDESLREQLSNAALAAHQYVGLEYMSRCDFRVHDHVVYLLDVNAMPNLHPVKSLFPQILQHHGQSLKTLFTRMLSRHKLLRSGSMNADTPAVALLN